LWTELYFASRPGIRSSIIMPSVAVSCPPEHPKYITSTLRISGSVVCFGRQRTLLCQEWSCYSLAYSTHLVFMVLTLLKVT